MNNGRVLSEEEVQRRLSQAYGAVHSSVLTEAWHTEIQNLIVTIRDRDKTIASLEMGDNEALQGWMEECLQLREKNAIMLLALELMSDTDADDSHWYMELATDTIAQVKSLTVSKQEESTVSEVACEQTNKESDMR